MIPRLLQFTQFVNEPHLQLEAAWILTNITSGNAEQTKAVVDLEALPYIISLLKSPQPEIVEQVIFSLHQFLRHLGHMDSWKYCWRIK